MKIFTIENGKVTPGVKVEKFMLYGGEKPVIAIGEEGAGREREIIRVHLIRRDQYRKWGRDNFTLNFASIIRNNNGKPELWPELNDTEEDNAEKNIICVFRTRLGSLGGNSHTGDNIGKNSNGYYEYAPFPGTYLCSSHIAKGKDGIKGYGEQIIAVMPSNCVFRTGYSDTRTPPGDTEGDSHYYKWDGEELLGGLTMRERRLSGPF